jgi:hypothetical protein
MGDKTSFHIGQDDPYTRVATRNTPALSRCDEPSRVEAWAGSSPKFSTEGASGVDERMTCLRQEGLNFQ